VARLVEPPADRRPDGTGTQDDDAHGPCWHGRRGCRLWRRTDPYPGRVTTDEVRHRDHRKPRAPRAEHEAGSTPAPDPAPAARTGGPLDRLTRPLPVVTAPLRMAGQVGGQVAAAPGRALAALTAPARDDLRRDLRRAFGIPATPRPAADDPETAYLAPDGVARRLHGDLPSMVIGGLAALFLQTLHPLAMAGVAEHSGYKEDPSGRLRRTAAFVGTTTFGNREDARQAIEQVQRVHRRVRGTAPDGRPYSASDPDLLTWVHVAEVWSFLAAVQRYGPTTFSDEECDAYLAETAAAPLELGARWVPQSRDEMTAYLLRMRPDLYAGPQAIEARDWLLRGVARRIEDRAVYTVICAAAVGVLPDWARAELRLPSPPLADALVVRPLARSLCAGIRWAVSPAGSTRRD